VGVTSFPFPAFLDLVCVAGSCGNEIIWHKENSLAVSVTTGMCETGISGFGAQPIFLKQSIRKQFRVLGSVQDYRRSSAIWRR
jgi:hypothetical protein